MSVRRQKQREQREQREQRATTCFGLNQRRLAQLSSAQRPTQHSATRLVLFADVDLYKLIVLCDWLCAEQLAKNVPDDGCNPARTEWVFVPPLARRSCSRSCSPHYLVALLIFHLLYFPCPFPFRVPIAIVAVVDVVVGPYCGVRPICNNDRVWLWLWL